MSHQPKSSHFATSGPHKAKIVLVGEAHGQSEDETKRPFVGESGKELFLMLGEATRHQPDLHEVACQMQRYGAAWIKPREAWLEASSILMTNVFAFRPTGNRIDSLCQAKKDLPTGYSEPMLSPGQYIRPDYLPELVRLQDEIKEAKPNIVVALGNVACWALLGRTNIGQIRGAITQARPEYQWGASPLKVLPTYHPAGVMRQWAW